MQAELERSFELDQHDSERPPGREELLRRVAGRDGLMLMLTDRVDDELLDAAGPQLRVVANYAVGLDNVDLDACRRRGVVVSNTPDVLTEATAELTVALILALLRRVAEGDRLIRRGEPWIWAPNLMLGRGLAGLTLGLVGYGRIGQAVERLALVHGMGVVHTRRGGGTTMDALLAEADVVSLHLPLTDETRHLIDAAALAGMKPGAVLVNTSRGPIVDEEALVAALAEMIDATALVVARVEAREVEVGAAKASSTRRPRCTPTSTFSVSAFIARRTISCPSGLVTPAAS